MCLVVLRRGFSIIGARVLLNMMEVAAEGPASQAIEL